MATMPVSEHGLERERPLPPRPRVPKDLLGECPKPIIKRYLCTDLAEVRPGLPVELAQLFEDARAAVRPAPSSPGERCYTT